MIQIGMHAGSAGGADRYFDGLCRAFDAMGMPYKGFVFEGRAAECDLPREVQVLGSADLPIRKRLALLRSAVTARINAETGTGGVAVDRSLQRPNLKPEEGDRRSDGEVAGGEWRVASGGRAETGGRRSEIGKGEGESVLPYDGVSVGTGGGWRSEVGGRREVVASHFALYSWPVIHPLARRRRDVAAVSHFHGPWADESAMEGASKFAVAGKRMLERWVYRSADRVIAASEAFRRVAIETYGVRADKVVAVPLAMDARPFAAAAELPRKLAREKLGWPADRRIVFCLRRLTRRMGLDRLVDAWKLVVSAHPNALLVIGGTGPLRNELEEQVHKNGLGSHVLFAGFVAEEDLPTAYRAADFSVVPSVAMEGFGLVILESLAAGTPALVTPVGGMPEIMRPLEAGLVLPGAGVAEVERGLTDLLAGRLPVPEERACVEYVRRNYNWELAARRVMDVYAAAEQAR